MGPKLGLWVAPWQVVSPVQEGECIPHAAHLTRVVL